MSTLTPESMVAVIGTGYMGGGIAQTFALAGHPVAVADATLEQAERAVRRLVAEGEAHEGSGLFPEGAHEALRERLTPATVEDAASRAAYITEAVPEQVALKHDVLGAVSAAASPDAIIASNTSAIPIGELAATVTGPERFLGVHWMNPSYFVPSVEIIPTERTDPQVATGVVDLIRAIGKVPTIVSDSPGFVANRLQFALYKECTRMVEEGIATPDQIDEVVRNSFGFRLPFFGPFAISDIAGLDVYAGSMATMERAYGERLAVPAVLAEHVASGRLGMKSGQGFYRHGPEDAERVRDYRDTAYARLVQVRAELADREPPLHG
ncbi:3-hydroxyacyl-CoA dehydrogenase family protein [Ornithinimicrobium cavernae]|uniref:3-hydroxyacyl-CoA dehydrogenase family protein n=1 Tax=Ornithinimicrobium cavernae TaxID=2666047 RepID=UPI00192A6164|nr:3-hydroxyacyl-CoA dehydrogenase family protein [Ornithinimicrobium cavernae]